MRNNDQVRRYLFSFLVLGWIGLSLKAIAHPESCDREVFATRYVESYLQAMPLNAKEVEEAIALSSD